MKYTLMHKNVKVIDVEINEDGKITKHYNIYNIDHMPFGTNYNFKNNGISLLNEWFTSRVIPVTRDSVEGLKKYVGDKSFGSLVLQNNALSLSDQYWIKKEKENVIWEDINFFENDFSSDLGDLLINNTEHVDYDLVSPDSTSVGNLAKRWKIINGYRALVKSGTKPYYYEVFNEIIASKIMTRLGINHINYYYIEDNNKPYSYSVDFISTNQDLVTFYMLYKSGTKNNNDSLYTYLMNILAKLDVPNYKVDINKMLFIDYLIGNTDRHLNNIGLIRNAKTLEFEGLTPVFDSGSSLGFDMNDNQLNKVDEVEWKPFKTKKVINQLDLIDDYSWLDPEDLKYVINDINDVCYKYKEYISENRRLAIVSFVKKRIEHIYSILGYNPNKDLNKLDLQVYEYFVKNKTLNRIDDLCELLGKSHITIQRTINHLIEKELIVRVGANKNGYWKINE